MTTDSSSSIGIAFGTNAGGGTLTGTTPVTVVSGVATFSDLSINKTGIGYTLKATKGALTQTSTAFNITPGAATQLVFTQQPTTTVAGATITPAVTVDRKSVE